MLALNLGDLEYLILMLVSHKCYDYKFEQLYLVCVVPGIWLRAFSMLGKHSAHRDIHPFLTLC